METGKICAGTSNKVYAVRIGRKPDIYNTWTDAQAQVTGFPLAEHKSFTTRNAAEAWLADKSNNNGNSKYNSFSRDIPNKDVITEAMSETDAIAKVPQYIGTTPIAYTDGSCCKQKNSVGRGKTLSAGFGFLLLGVGYYGKMPVMQQSNGVNKPVSAQQAEIYAIYCCLCRALELQLSTIIVMSDSKYAVNTFTTWYPTWQQHNWHLANGDPVDNLELVKMVVSLLSKIKVEFLWIKGHGGDPGNEVADMLAKKGSAL